VAPWRTFRTNSAKDFWCGMLESGGMISLKTVVGTFSGPVASWQMWQVPLTINSPTRADGFAMSRSRAWTPSSPASLFRYGAQRADFVVRHHGFIPKTAEPSRTPRPGAAEQESRSS
jgi:hypothetical protein